MLESEEKNHIKEILRDKVVLANSAGFWEAIREIRPRELGDSPDPGEIDKETLYYNLGRFGYTAFTMNKKETEKKEKISIETLIMGCLFAGDARLEEAITILLAKNQVNYRLLLYLALKYNKINRTGYLIEMTSKLFKKKERKEELDEGLKFFEIFRDETIKSSSKDPIARRWDIRTRTDRKDFEKKMRLYNAI